MHMHVHSAPHHCHAWNGCAAVQDDSTPVDTEAAVWDATALLAHAAPCREAVAAGALLPCAADRALGRGATPSVRMAAMHALAGAAGAEVLGEPPEPSAALLSPEVPCAFACMQHAHGRREPESVPCTPNWLGRRHPLRSHVLRHCTCQPCATPFCMPPHCMQHVTGGGVCARADIARMQVEQRLQAAVYENALPSEQVELGPAQRMLELLQQPFADGKVRAHACGAWKRGAAGGARSCVRRMHAGARGAPLLGAHAACSRMRPMHAGAGVPPLLRVGSAIVVRTGHVPAHSSAGACVRAGIGGGGDGAVEAPRVACAGRHRGGCGHACTRTVCSAAA
jgi:hypothetical protein